MPKINLIPMQSDDRRDPVGAYKHQAALAAAMMGAEAKPVHSTGQGLLNVAEKAFGGWLARDAQEGAERADDMAWNPLKAMVDREIGRGSDAPASGGIPSGPMGRFTPPEPASSGDEVRSRNNTAAASERAKAAFGLYQKLGYSPHAAQGIVDNLMEESGLEPVRAVGDGGTAFGVAQWRGPRFKNLQRFAQKNGKDWRDFETQLRFVDFEMKTGLDAGAARAYAGLQQAKDPREAHEIFLRHYERPHSSKVMQRLASRAKQYQGGPDAQYAQGTADPSGRGGFASATPAGPDFSAQDQAIQEARVLMDSRQTRAQGFAIYQQAIKEKGELLREWQKSQREDNRLDTRLSVDAEQHGERMDLERQKFTHEKGKGTVVGRDSRLVVDGKEVVSAMPKEPSNGIVVENADGTRTIIGGTGTTKGPTEIQAKWGLYYKRGTQANTNLSRMENALTALDEDLATKYGGRLGNYYASEKFQMAKQAADGFLVTILRPDTGAAVTDTEFETYGRIFLPRPGDKAGTIKQKREARERALEALKSGMSPQEVLKMAVPEEFDGISTVPNYVVTGEAPVWEKQAKAEQKPAPAAPEAKSGFELPKAGDVIDGWRFKGGDPSRRESWEKAS